MVKKKLKYETERRYLLRSPSLMTHLNVKQTKPSEQILNTIPRTYQNLLPVHFTTCIS